MQCQILNCCPALLRRSENLSACKARHSAAILAAETSHQTKGRVEKVCFLLSFDGSNWEVWSWLIAGAPLGA